MAIGERIRFFKNLKGMTQKYLGMQIGFSEKTADIRMVQYESGTRTLKTEATNDLVKVLDVSPQALTVPDIDSYNGLMHTLFALEDLYVVLESIHFLTKSVFVLIREWVQITLLCQKCFLLGKSNLKSLKMVRL